MCNFINLFFIFQTHPTVGNQSAGEVWRGVEGPAGGGAGGRQNLPAAGQAVLVRGAGDLQPSPDVTRERSQIYGQEIQKFLQKNDRGNFILYDFNCESGFMSFCRIRVRNSPRGNGPEFDPVSS
jgi:hypothetical protein